MKAAPEHPPQSPTEPQRKRRSTSVTQRTSAGNGVAVQLPDGRTLLVKHAPADLLDACTEDDPALVFAWRDSAVAAVLPHLAAYVPRPLWFPAGHTTDALRDSIVHHVCTIATAIMQSHGAAIVAPLTLPQFAEVIGILHHLCTDPAMVAAYAAAAPRIGPLAVMYLVHDASRPAKAAAANVARTPPHGVQAFD